MKFPQECDLCNSPKIHACDECEQTLSFICDRCNGMFEVDKPEDDRSRWCDSRKICETCGLNKATLFGDSGDICNECKFNTEKGNK